MEQELQQFQVNLQKLEELVAKLSFLNREIAYLLKIDA